MVDVVDEQSVHLAVVRREKPPALEQRRAGVAVDVGAWFASALAFVSCFGGWLLG